MHAYASVARTEEESDPDIPLLAPSSPSSPRLTSHRFSLPTPFTVSKRLSLRDILFAFTALCLALVLLFYSGQWLVHTFWKPGPLVLVFGDSFSDDCNAWRLVGPPEDVRKYPFPKCPPALTPEAIGALKWPDRMRRNTGVELLNFAYSASTCSNNLFNVTAHNPTTGEHMPLPATIDEIEKFRASGRRFHPANTVAIVFTGTNDITAITTSVRDDIFHDAKATSATVEDEARCVVDRVQQLYDLGLRRIVVMSNIPLERAPFFANDLVFAGMTQNATVISKLVAGLVAENIKRQRDLLSALQPQLLDAELQIFDTYALYTELYNDPISTYGPQYNVSVGCWNCAPATCSVCDNPDTHMFRDHIHPGPNTHEAIARRMAEFIGLPPLKEKRQR